MHCIILVADELVAIFSALKVRSHKFLVVGNNALPGRFAGYDPG